MPNDIQRSFHLMRELDKDSAEFRKYVLYLFSCSLTQAARRFDLPLLVPERNRQP